MRVSRHNGRSGSHGAYNPKHNDREFDLEKAEEIEKEMTRNNLYWNCITEQIVRHNELASNALCFTDVEKRYYDLVYMGYVNGQNDRNIKAGHRERCRTTDDLRTNSKTCPEETIYQIGDMNTHADPEVLAEIATQFFETIRERYGDHVHILDWALHLDESTPHIHERHVFDVTNRYGERQPKQEQALKELGFELPDPSKKEGKFNNRKMSYDAECRSLLMEICKEHGLVIEEEPIYGGRKYLEKQEFIASQINEKNQSIRAENDKLLTDNSSLQNEKAALQDDLGKLDDEIMLKELKLSDVDAFIGDVTNVAYDKACEIMVDEIAETMRKESSKEVSALKNELSDSDDLKTKVFRKFAIDQLSRLQKRFSGVKDRVVNAIRRNFSSAARKEQLISRIIEESRPSILEILHTRNEAIKEQKDRAIDAPERKRRNDPCL